MPEIHDKPPIRVAGRQRSVELNAHSWNVTRGRGLKLRVFTNGVTQ